MLADVIAISTKECGKDKRYMVLDGPVQHEPLESKPYAFLVSLRDSVVSALLILLLLMQSICIVFH